MYGTAHGRNNTVPCIHNECGAGAAFVFLIVRGCFFLALALAFFSKASISSGVAANAAMTDKADLELMRFTTHSRSYWLMWLSPQSHFCASLKLMFATWRFAASPSPRSSTDGTFAPTGISTSVSLSSLPSLPSLWSLPSSEAFSMSRSSSEASDESDESADLPRWASLVSFAVLDAPGAEAIAIPAASAEERAVVVGAGEAGCRGAEGTSPARSTEGSLP